jgi:predicted transposase YdaD
MQHYDSTLKLLLRESAKVAMREIIGVEVEWLNVELPKVQNPKVDLLGEAADGSLVHLELQSTNDPDMALRMAEYSLGVYRLYRRFPRQILLYVGQAAIAMPRELRGPEVRFRYRTVDFRELDGEKLVASPELGDNVIAILARLRDDREAVRKIVRRISGLSPTAREEALSQLLVLSGLRRLEAVVKEEARYMPIYIDLAENQVLGPAYKKGVEDGERKGEEKGEQKGERAILRRQIKKRFGPMPEWARKRFMAMSITQLEQLADRMLDAHSLEELLK